MGKSIRPETTVFLAVLGVTIVIWVMRGVGLLTFIPGGTIWILILLTIGSAIYAWFQATRR